MSSAVTVPWLDDGAGCCGSALVPPGCAHDGVAVANAMRGSKRGDSGDICRPPGGWILVQSNPALRTRVLQRCVVYVDKSRRARTIAASCKHSASAPQFLFGFLARSRGYGFAPAWRPAPTLQATAASVQHCLLLPTNCSPFYPRAQRRSTSGTRVSWLATSTCAPY